MADKSKIEWTDATWNPVRGCSRVSEGCRHCYAEAVAARFSGPGQPYEGLAKRVGGEPRWTGKVRFVPGKLGEPLGWRRPRMVFVNSMSDLFHERLSFAEIGAVFGIMAFCHEHTFQVLTKRPERAAEFFRWLEGNPLQRERDGGERERIDVPAVALLELASAHLPREDWRKHFALHAVAGLNPAPGAKIRENWPLPNVWLGTSVEDQATADQRIPELLRCPAAIRFVSYEPALGPVDFGAYLERSDKPPHHEAIYGILTTGGQWLDWIIVGGESGRAHRPMEIAWVESAVEQCAEASVALFVKQDSGPKPGRQGRIPDHLWIKQYPVEAAGQLTIEALAGEAKP